MIYNANNFCITLNLSCNTYENSLCIYVIENDSLKYKILSSFIL